PPAVVLGARRRGAAGDVRRRADEPLDLGSLVLVGLGAQGEVHVVPPLGQLRYERRVLAQHAGPVDEEEDAHRPTIARLPARRPERQAGSGSLATGSGSSSANGCSTPFPASVSERCEKNRVITTPSRKSP